MSPSGSPEPVIHIKQPMVSEPSSPSKEQEVDSPRRRGIAKRQSLPAPVSASQLLTSVPSLSLPDRRSRKQLNYQKLNEGILC